MSTFSRQAHSQEILDRALSARDYHKEMEQLYAVDFHLPSIVNFVKKQIFEPAAEAALLSLCGSSFGIEHVERAIDPVYAHEAWQKNMLAEWSRRAERPDELAVMSTRYPADRLCEVSRDFTHAVMNFLRGDIVGKDVLEIGGGIGRLTEPIFRAAGRLTCIECSEPMLVRNRRRLGPMATQVRYIRDFIQNYQPPTKHDVVVCSLVIVHNVDDEEFNKLAEVVASSADTVFLAEHVDKTRTPHRHTKIRSEEELIRAFPDFSVERRGDYLLFHDPIVFLKLKRAHSRAEKTERGESRPLIRTEQGDAESQRRATEQRTHFERAICRVRDYAVEAQIAPGECFISYAWGVPAHEYWVEKRLAADLQRAGITVLLDRWDNAQIGASVAKFVERIEECGRVIVVGTPLYRRKAKNIVSTKGSVVASEWDLAGMRLLATEDKKRTVLPILLAGDESESFPPLLRGRVYGDFRKDEAYFLTAFDLILSLYQLPPNHTAVADLRESLRDFERKGGSGR